MATMSPELILASYSCARRDHMVRLMRARPFRVSSARLTSAGSDSLRMPTLATFAVGTRSVILSFMKLITNSSSFAPAISCSSMARIWPTPWAGYTTNSWGLTGAWGATAFGAGLWAAGVDAATFEAVAFEPVAFAAVFAVLFGIELLLFLEDLAAEALVVFRESFADAGARPLDAPRLVAAAAFLEAFEVLFVRVFCDTACARNCHAPVRCFHGNPWGPISGLTGSASYRSNIAHFPQKSMIYALPAPSGGRFVIEIRNRVKPI